MQGATLKEQIIGELETLRRRLASGDIDPGNAALGIRQSIDRLEALPDPPPSAYAGDIGTTASQAVLAESERRFRTVFDQAFQLMGQLSTEGILQVINGKAQDYLAEIGVDATAVIGKHFWDTPWWSHSEAERRRLQDAIAEARQGGTVRYETTHPFGNGIIHVDFSLKPVWDEAGHVILLIAEGRDITDHKVAETKLKESEESFRALAESSPDTIMRFDRQGRHLYVNPSVERDVGIPVSAWIGKTHREMGFPEDLVALWEDCLQQVFRTGREHQVEFMLPNGLWKDWILAPEMAAGGQVSAVMTSARDITKRKQAEMSLDKEKKFSRLLLDTSPALIVAISNEGKTLMMNKALLDILEYGPEEIINSDYLSTFVPEEDRLTLMDVFQQIVREGKATVNENRIISKSGRIYLVEWHGRPVIRKDGDLEFFVGVGIDITERRQAEAALESMHRQMTAVVNSLPDASFVVDKEQRVIAWNKAIEDISGVPKEEMIGKGDHEYAIPFYGDRRRVLIDILFLPNDEIEKKYENVQRRGHTIYGEAFTPKVYGGRGAHLWGIATPLFDEGGNITGAIETLRDFTEHKEMEIALRRSENLFRSLFENAGIGIALTNEDGLFQRVNPRYAEITGYDEDELRGLSFIHITHPDDIATNRAMYEELIAGKRDRFQMEKRYVRKDGRLVWARLTSTMVAGGQGISPFFVSMVEDITERKQAENSLQESERRFRMLAEKAPFGISLMNPDLSFAYLNPQFTAIFGYTRQDIPDKGTWFAKAYPDADYMKEVESAWKQDLGHYGSAGISGERIYKVRCKDGSDKTIHFQSVILDTGTHVMTYEDVSARFAAEEALRESEAKYRLLIDNANVAICVIQDDKICFANPRFADLSGYAFDEIPSLSLAGLVHAEDRKPMIEKHLQTLQGGLYPTPTIVRGCTNTGEQLWIDVNAVRVIWEGKPAVLYFLRDMTRQRQLEQQLLQAQKMEAIGTLAGGIAHDFNNILTAIQGYAALAMMHVRDNVPVYEKLRNIEGQVQSGANLTRQLLGFARGGKYEILPTNINDVVQQTVKLFGRTRKDVEIHFHLQEDLWIVDADRGQIEQVLLNLFVNAWQAMPGGGEIFIETCNIVLADRTVEAFELRGGEYVKVTVTDTGVGMDKNTLKRVFEPFFTTKEKGMGTGLGLASVYGIIRNHGGFINAYSELGRGAVFNFHLPVSGRSLASEVKNKEEVLTGNETILVVEDEQSVLETTAELLESLGYRVQIAGGGQEAIAIYLEKKDQIDLVMLDMVMPGMSGEKTFEMLREICPEVKVILSTGFSETGPAKAIMQKGCNGFIQKPYNIIDLSKKLREVLER